MLANRFGDIIREELDEMHGEFKGDLACTECRVGINDNEETFIITPDSFAILCKVCTKDLKS
jgi:hypothetical protein